MSATGTANGYAREAEKFRKLAGEADDPSEWARHMEKAHKMEQFAEEARKESGAEARMEASNEDEHCSEQDEEDEAFDEDDECEDDDEEGDGSHYGDSWYSNGDW